MLNFNMPTWVRKIKELIFPFSLFVKQDTKQ